MVIHHLLVHLHGNHCNGFGIRGEVRQQFVITEVGFPPSRVLGASLSPPRASGASISTLPAWFLGADLF